MRFRLRLGIAALLITLCVRSRAAADELVVIVSSASAIAGLTKDQIADIFLGKLRQLPDGTKVVPIDQPEGSPTRDAFYVQFTGKSPAQVKAHWSKIIFTGRGQPPPTATDAAETKKRVAQDPRAIAYIQRTLADDSVRMLPP